MAKFKRDLIKGEHPFDIDGYWWGWIDAKGNYWTLRTIDWVGRPAYKQSGIRRGNLESVQEFVNSHKKYSKSQSTKMFYHPIKEQAVQLRNVTKFRMIAKGRREHAHI